MKYLNTLIARFYASILAISGLILIHGCAFTPDNRGIQEDVINSEALSLIKRIGLLDVPVPSEIWLGDPSSDAGLFFFGLAGTFAAASHTGDRVVDGKIFSKTTQNEMRDWLEKAGFEVILLEAKRLHPSKMLLNYDQFEAVNADAILEVAPIQVGFREKSGEIHLSEGELSPDVGFVYKLISTKNGETIFASNVFYSSFDYSNNGQKSTILLGPKQHLFKDVKSVMSRPKEAVKRLSFAIKGATEFIAMNIANEKRTLQYSGLHESDITSAYQGSGNPKASAIEFYGQAEDEVNTNTYDKNLWAAALVEADGDETEGKFRYIVLRANQLFLENEGSKSSSNKDEQSVHGSDVTGTYVSDIGGGTGLQFKNRKLVITLKQSGDDIIGTDVSQRKILVGTQMGDTIKFKVLTRMTQIPTTGVWKINPDGVRIEGTWSSSWGYGKWNLTKTE